MSVFIHFVDIFVLSKEKEKAKTPRMKYKGF